MKNKVSTFAKSLGLCAVLLCGVSADAEEQVLRVGTEPAFAPFEYIDESNSELVGFDIDLIKAVAAAEGYSVELSQMPFDGLIPAVLTGQLEAAIAGFTITDERKKRVAFSAPYYDAGLGVLVKAELKDSIKNVADLSGHSICVQIGTSGALYAQNDVKDAKVTQFNTSTETYMELAKGGCDAVINDKPVHEYYLAKTKPQNMHMLPEFITSEQYGIVIGKNDEKTQQIIASGLKKIQQNGTYNSIYEKWFGAKK
ncbi:MAG: basic amino acid ABC transporter substrate-binding protein [Succinivibrio sp.]|nr:basic amino acid ABC transporter substrate-binding protein [Succinivibrio sp.]